MTVPTADRNLLFGILALQLDFISRDQMVDAMNRWLIEKSRDLADILVEQQALTPERHRLLNALVQEHLEQHQNDPAVSLAALNSLEDVREELTALADAEIEESLARVPKDPRTDGEESATEAFSVGHLSSSGRRFRVVRPHRQGGIGLVSVAIDEELNREVALKEIQAEHADEPHSRERFVSEAEIAGGLEHPSIVPVYGLGQYADGRPYYAMKFVRGDSLREAIERMYSASVSGKDRGSHSIEFRKLLGRFIDVCDAVQYAHSRGVLHRDLKPGNIMLGKYGETLVVDWGLAKAGQHVEQPGSLEEGPLQIHASSDSTDTVAGSLVGTPAYMSPEQAAGRVELLGVETDVYALGATLYCILTGNPPFHFGDEELGVILRRVQDGEFAKPREIGRKVPRPLEAICLKAMEKSPADRYQSPRQLADDVEAWLADEPVSSWREPAPQRLARFARHHKVFVASVAATLIVAVVSLSIGIVMLSAANQRERAAKTLADQNYRLAREAVDEYLTRVSENTRLKAHDLEELRRDLLDTARHFYDEFAEQGKNDPQLQADRAAAYSKLGSIVADIESPAAALPFFQKAQRLYEQLADVNPTVSDYGHSVAEAGNNIGEMHRLTGNYDEAESTYLETLDAYQGLLASDASDEEAQHGLAVAYNNLALVYQKTGRFVDAERTYKESVEDHHQLVQAHPTIAAYQRSLALSHANLGVHHDRLGQNELAEQSHLAAIKIWKQLADEHQDDHEFPGSLASAYVNLGHLYAKTGNYSQAKQSYEVSLEINKRVFDLHPKVLEYQADLANAHTSLGNFLYQAAQARQAYDHIDQSLEILERLVRQVPNLPTYQEQLAVAHVARANVCKDLRLTAERAESHRQAVDGLEKLVQLYPNVPDYQRELSTALSNQGGFWETLHERDRARTAYERSLEVAEALVSAFPTIPGHAITLARAKMTYGDFLVNEQQYEEAIKTQSNAAAAYRRVVEENSDVPEYQQEWLIAKKGLGGTYLRAGQLQPSEEELVAARDLAAELMDRYPDAPAFQRELASVNRLLGTLYSEHRDFVKAAAAFGESIRVYSKLVDDYPEVAGYRNGLGKAYNTAGQMHMVRAEVEAGLGMYKKGLDIRVKLVDEFPEIPEHRRNLAISHTNLTQPLWMSGKHEEASETAEAATEIYEQLQREFPNVAEFKREAAAALNNLGNVHMFNNRLDKAEAAFRRGVKVSQALVEQNPNDVNTMLALCATTGSLGTILQKQGKTDESLGLYDVEIQKLEAVLAQSPKLARAVLLLRNAFINRAAALSSLDRDVDALPDWKRAQELDFNGEHARTIIQGRALSYVKTEEYQIGCSLIEELADQIPDDGKAQFEAACILSAAIKAAADDERLEPAERDQRATEYAGRAVARLNQAKAAGFFSDADPEDVRNHKRLTHLSGRPEFVEFLQSLVESSSPDS